eukprot:TRINITY_DN13660_c0_g1_i1.p2 TRINITY_DN13660_c0_g1~~TRINITY_DN13660_c0_g1_i1.p2  ORF type:complete len:107 (+),score=2.77 TRINITY_DN13660_c0_g1_i1:494-814(+)
MVADTPNTKTVCDFQLMCNHAITEPCVSVCSPAAYHERPHGEASQRFGSCYGGTAFDDTPASGTAEDGAEHSALHSARYSPGNLADAVGEDQQKCAPISIIFLGHS